MKKNKPTIILAVGLTIGLVVGVTLKFSGAEGIPILSTVHAAESSPKFSPVEPRARDFYAPNSEALGPNEMRLSACGTGMATARPKQAASCWLLDLGNGDKFIFDIGTGANERISARRDSAAPWLEW